MAGGSGSHSIHNTTKLQEVVPVPDPREPGQAVEDYFGVAVGVLVSVLLLLVLIILVIVYIVWTVLIILHATHGILGGRSVDDGSQ